MPANNMLFALLRKKTELVELNNNIARIMQKELVNLNKTEFIKFLQSCMLRTRELEIAALDTSDDWGMAYFEGQMDTIKHIKTMVENNIFDFATDEVV